MTFLFALSFLCLWQSLWHRFSAIRVLEVPVLIPDIWTQVAESSCKVVCVAAMRFDVCSCMVCMMTRMPWYTTVYWSGSVTYVASYTLLPLHGVGELR